MKTILRIIHNSIKRLVGKIFLKFYNFQGRHDLQDDIDPRKYFIKASEKKIEVPKDFMGFEAYGGGKRETIIDLKQDELIYFD
jgi:hypothetical protein